MENNEVDNIMHLKDWLTIVIMPLLLGLFATFWPVIQNRHRRRIFTQLILRELQEISPYPEEVRAENCVKWQDHCQKTFIHRKIFEQPNENRDFILSLEPDLVYFVSQLWHSLEADNREQWDYCLSELSKKYDPPSYKTISKLDYFLKSFKPKRYSFCGFCVRDDDKSKKSCQRKICVNRHKWKNIYQDY